MEGLISKMRNIHKSTPSSFRRRDNAAAIVKAPPLGALTKGPDRKFPGFHPPLGFATSPSLSTNRRFAFPILALLAALAVGLLFLIPGGPLHAQDADGPIMYAENGTGAVATFTAVDPEGESIIWSLAVSTDMDDFDIENGVLRFKSSPDYESPADSGMDNTYEVTIQASDGGTDTAAIEAVTIDVTNVDEPGEVTLSTLQPQVGVAIMATLDDPDNETVDTVSWQWYRGTSPIAGATSGDGIVMSSYTPVDGDVGSVLRAKAMYDDGEDEDKTAREDSAHAVREAPEANIPPTFPTPSGQEDTNQTREVAENTPSGTNLGDPVVASDPDVLTYSLEGSDEASFSIDRATGQLQTKAKLDYEDQENANQQYVVMVKATDPFGAEATARVTIMVTDVNEAPMVTGAASIDHAESNEESVTALAPNAYIVMDADEDDDVAADADVKWTLSGADAGKFDITGTGATRALVFKANPDYESPGDSGGNNVYEVTVVVTDSKGNTDEQDVTVKVTNVEEDGMVTLSTLQPRVGFPVTATLSDPDNVDADSVSWQWYRGETDTSVQEGSLPTAECEDDTPNNCAIKDAASGTYTAVADDTGDHLYAVAMYTDGSPNTGDAKDVVLQAAMNRVLVDTRNKAPVFPDQDDEMEGRQTAQERMIAENTAAAEDIGDPVVATDEDAVLTYSLGGPDAAAFDIVRNSGQLQTKADLDKEKKDTYTVTVTAADSLSESSTITVTIKVTNIDEMPKLEGDDPEDYAENGTGVVARFTATDPEGESIVWMVTGSDSADFSIENGVLRFKSSPDYETPEDSGEENDYEVTIEASDGGQGTTATKDVTVDVTNVDENGTVTLSTLQPQVVEEITATLSDPDNVDADSVSWQWYRGSNPITNADNGAGTVTSRYTPTTGDVGSALRAKAMYDDSEDDDKTAQENSYRSVRRAPETNTDPVFPTPSGQPNTNQTREVAENTPAGRNLGAPVAASDSGDVLTYSLDSGEDAAFDINRVTGQLSTKAALDFEGPPDDHMYTVTVTATDPSGKLVMAEVTIEVTDVNEDPSVMGDASIDHPENGTALAAEPTVYTASDPDAADLNADLKWTLSGADAGKFELDGSGATRTLVFEDAPNYESPGDSGGNNVYEVTVVITDSKGNTDEQDVTVKVTNVEEAGTVTLSTLQPRVSFPVTATLADADNITAGSVSWQWYRGAIENPPSSLPEECATADDNRCAIKGATSDTYTPVTDDITDTLSAVATYTDGFANEGDAKDMRAGAEVNTVLADTRNRAPVFPDQDDVMDGRQTDHERSVPENVPVIGSNAATVLVRTIGEPVVATDSITENDGMTADETLTYSLGGPDAASFTIHRGTAQLSTKVELDKETKDTYVVMVTATDPSGETATVMVTIKVTNVDEAPEIMVGGLAISGMRSVGYAENGTMPVGTYMAAGPDAAMATWTLSGDDAGDFRISSGGMLTFRSSPDYENPTDMGMDNMYMVTIMADDGNYMDTHDVMVMVTNEDEPGRVTFWRDGADATAAAIMVGDMLGGAVDDSDGNPGDTFPIAMYMRIANVTSWQWAKTMTPDMMDSWMPIGTGGMYTVMDDDAGHYLRATATYTDGEGMGKMASEETMMVMMTTMNAAPMFESETDTRVVAENTAAGEDIGNPVAANDANGDTLAYTLGGTDVASFDIGSATGQLITKAALDYEAKASYVVTVTATDPDRASDMITVTITVTNVDEPGMVTLWAGNDPLTMAPQVGDTITGLVVDPDGSVTGEMWQWSRTMDTADMSSWMEITDATEAAYMVTADDEGYYLRVMATYTDAVGTAMVDSMPTMMVVPVGGGDHPLVTKFDYNGNGQIDKSDVVDAINAYLDEVEGISKTDVIDLINYYLDG